MRTSIFFQILNLIPTLLVGNIIETNRFEDILMHADRTNPNKTLVVCDIDNTLIMACEPLGSVAWGEYLENQLQSRGVSKEDSAVIEHLLWKTIQPHIEVQTVDPKTAEVIQKLKVRQIPVLGLTARFPEDAWFTFEQLNSVLIDFSFQEALPKVNLQIPLGLTASYEKGILFSTTVNNKSSVFLQFMQLHQMELEHVIFVDDKLHHVEDIEKACQKIGIECTGIRFSGADKHVQAFDPEKAKLQWQNFGEFSKSDAIAP